MKKLSTFLILVPALFISSCAYENTKSLSYDALHTRQCLKDTGAVNCDEEKIPYDEYEKQRQEILNKK